MGVTTSSKAFETYVTRAGHTHFCATYSHITGPVIDAPAVAAILEREAIRPIQKHAALRGIADKIVVYEIP